MKTLARNIFAGMTSYLVMSFGRRGVGDKQVPSFLTEIEDRSTNWVWAISKLAKAGGGFHPGSANDALADLLLATFCLNASKAEIQWEVLVALWQRDPEWCRENAAFISPIFPEEGRRLDLEAVLTRSYEAVGIANWSPVIICHPAMLSLTRDRYAVKMPGQSPLIISGNAPFDSEAVKPYCSQRQWALYETRLRWRYLWS